MEINSYEQQRNCKNLNDSLGLRHLRLNVTINLFKNSEFTTYSMHVLPFSANLLFASRINEIIFRLADSKKA